MNHRHSLVRYRPGIAATAFVVLASFCVPNAGAQTLLDMYRSALFQAQAERALADRGGRVDAFPVDVVPYGADSHVARIRSLLAPEIEPELPEEPTFVVNRWELVPRLARSWFRSRFADAEWAYVGSNRLTVLDTTFTRELRGKLQAEFGAPTQTISDLDHSAELYDGEYIQFEYWFVINDTIPLIVMDVNGPFDRGLVVAGDNRFRNELPDLKEVFLGPVARSDVLEPYVDYYYFPEQRTWYLSGFDGEQFILSRIPRPNLALGRPILERMLPR
jgi:hypothetical protein